MGLRARRKKKKWKSIKGEKKIKKMRNKKARAQVCLFVKPHFSSALNWGSQTTLHDFFMEQNT